VARIAVAAGTIRGTPGIFRRVQHNTARRCRLFNEVGGRHFEQLNCQKEAFPDMGVLTKYDQVEPIYTYLPRRVVTYIYLHPMYKYRREEEIEILMQYLNETKVTT
jgi:hypothetical protein